MHATTRLKGGQVGNTISLQNHILEWGLVTAVFISIGILQGTLYNTKWCRRNSLLTLSHSFMGLCSVQYMTVINQAGQWQEKEALKQQLLGFSFYAIATLGDSTNYLLSGGEISCGHWCMSSTAKGPVNSIAQLSTMQGQPGGSCQHTLSFMMLLVFIHFRSLHRPYPRIWIAPKSCV